MSRLDLLPRQDLERLSAYLDGNLTPDDVDRLRARLEAEPELRLGLAEMRQVVSAVRGLGEVRVPRNFTLRPAEALRREGAGFGYLRFATVVATALFVLTTTIRTLAGVSLQFGAAAPAAGPATSAAQEMFADAAGAALPASEAPLEAIATPAATSALPAPAGTAPPAPTLGAAAAPSPAVTATQCPSCPPSLAYRREAVQGPEGKTGEATAVEESRAAEISALAAAQWVLGAAVVILGVLTLRARRRR